MGRRFIFGFMVTRHWFIWLRDRNTLESLGPGANTVRAVVGSFTPGAGGVDREITYTQKMQICLELTLSS
jgi:hypothetical protein